MKQENAVKIESLLERIKQNENFQAVEINEWAFRKIKGSTEKMNILELCCGSGKQTQYLLKNFPNATVSCLDISEGAIDTVKNKYEKEAGRMKFYVDSLDSFFDRNDDKYDLVFVSYGLYYSKNIKNVLKGINNSLNPKGRLIVMGPHGDNNKEIFDLVSRTGVEIHKRIIHDSGKFMFEDLLSFCVNQFQSVKIDTVMNRIAWEKLENVINYWKNSTFYAPEKETIFSNLVAEAIHENGVFINSKHIMLVEATK